MHQIKDSNIFSDRRHNSEYFALKSCENNTTQVMLFYSKVFNF